MTKPVTVSDHALLRWMERRHGIDIETFRADLEAKARLLAMAGAAGGWVDGFYVVFGAPGRIRTVLPNQPLVGNHLKHDRGGTNGTDIRQPKPWQMHARKRSHV